MFLIRTKEIWVEYYNIGYWLDDITVGNYHCLAGQRMEWISEEKIEYIPAPWIRDHRLKCNSWLMRKKNRRLGEWGWPPVSGTHVLHCPLEEKIRNHSAAWVKKEQTCHATRIDDGRWGKCKKQRQCSELNGGPTASLSLESENISLYNKTVIALKIFRGGAFSVWGERDPTCDHRYLHRWVAEEVLRQMHQGRVKMELREKPPEEARNSFSPRASGGSMALLVSEFWTPELQENKFLFRL